ncbi:MAG: DmsC/YnfH family molybdoenzyme membrane anchor subunit [Alphaproteobacteria bacterium]
MKPAPSIIGFTTASGLGYGMLFVLALGALVGLIPTERWLGLAGLLLALASIGAGLIASTYHLGHPERAWRALSQWRSSWLSREGVFAVATFVPALLLTAGWVIGETVAGLFGLMALAAAAGAVGTVYCTGMIYASLPPIRAWHQPLTAPIYLAFALMTGLLAVQVLVILFGLPHLVLSLLTLAAIAGAFLLKFLYWRKLSAEQSDAPTVASAIGLGTSGLVRMLDPPHTQTNYLLDEMGFQIGRKHARMLRLLSVFFGLAVPLVLTLVLSMQLPWLMASLLAVIALISGMAGVLLERWLFFAEAEHTAMLYYGGHRQAAGRQVAESVASDKGSAAKAPPAPSRRRQTSPARRRPSVDASGQAPAHREARP